MPHRSDHAPGPEAGLPSYPLSARGHGWSEPILSNPLLMAHASHRQRGRRPCDHGRRFGGGLGNDNRCEAPDRAESGRQTRRNYKMRGRGSWIRTNDLQYPKLPRYQAALYPEGQRKGSRYTLAALPARRRHRFTGQPQTNGVRPGRREQCHISSRCRQSLPAPPSPDRPTE